MNRIALPLFVLLAGIDSHAQQAGKLEFEVASIKPSPPPSGAGYTVFCRGGPESNDPGLFTCQNTSLSSLVGMAYRVDYYQLSVADWMLTTRFDIRAVVPEGATKERFAVMLQSLLMDRFKLVVHHESKEIQRYELVVAKNGPKLKEHVEAKADDAARGAAGPPGPPARDKDGYPIIGPKGGMAIMGDKARMYWPALTMEMLAGRLSGSLNGPVTDGTGLAGKYDISIYWSTANSLSASVPGGDPPVLASDPGPTLMQALQEQLGLRVESRKGPVDFLVVDHAEKVPTEN